MSTYTSTPGGEGNARDALTFLSTANAENTKVARVVDGTVQRSSTLSSCSTVGELVREGRNDTNLEVANDISDGNGARRRSVSPQLMDLAKGQHGARAQNRYNFMHLQYGHGIDFFQQNQYVVNKVGTIVA